METIEALIHRRSCRKYSDRPVEAEKLARIIEAGQYAPSGMGRQPVTFVAVTDPATVERLSQLNAQVMSSEGDPFYGAKTVVVVLVDRSVPTHLEDGSLAMGNLLNAAYALGVDSCWIHRAHEVFDSPEGLELLAKWGLPPTEVCAVWATAFWAMPKTCFPRPNPAATTSRTSGN